MSKKYKVRTAAVFNGQPAGSTIELSEEIARKYEALKFLEIIEEVKPRAKRKSTSKKSTSATKKTTTKAKKPAAKKTAKK